MFTELLASGSGGNQCKGEFYYQGKTGITLFKNGEYIHDNTTNPSGGANFILNNISDVVSATNGQYGGVYRCRIIFSKDKYVMGNIGTANDITEVPYKVSSGTPMDIYQQGLGSNWSQSIAIFDEMPT